MTRAALKQMHIRRARSWHLLAARPLHARFYYTRAAPHGESPMHETVTLTWESSELKVNLAPGESDPIPALALVCVGGTEGEAKNGQTGRVLVRAGKRAGKAVFHVHGNPDAVYLGVYLLVGGREDADARHSGREPPVCEIMIASGLVGMPAAHTREITIPIVDTSGLPAYRLRCIDAHRGIETDRGTLTLRGLRIATSQRRSAASAPPLLSEKEAGDLDDYYTERLVMERHEQFIARHFQCVEQSLMSFQTVTHPAHTVTTRGGEKQLCIEDGLLFNEPPPVAPSPALLECLFRAACAKCMVDPNEMTKRLSVRPTWRKTALAKAKSDLKVLGTMLSMARAPYVADYHLDAGQARCVQRSSMRRFTEDEGGVADEVVGAGREGIVSTDALTYIDIADSLQAGDCEDGEKLAFDLFRALRDYRGQSMHLRTMAYLAGQFEAVRLDNRCAGNECHVFMALFPVETFCQAIQRGCTAWLERNSQGTPLAKEHGFYMAINSRAEYMLSRLMDVEENIEASKAAIDFIEGSLVFAPRLRASSILEPLFIESTAWTDPLTSFFREDADRHAKLDAIRESADYDSLFGRYFFAEITDRSSSWGDGALPKNLYRTVSPDDESKEYPFAFYRDVSGCVLDSDSPIFRTISRDQKQWPLRAVFGVSPSPQEPLSYGVTITSVAAGDFVIYPTSYADVHEDRSLLDLSKRLLTAERQLFRNLEASSPRPDSAVIINSRAQANVFYRPDITECTELFEEFFDETVFGREDAVVFEVDVRYLHSPTESTDLYQALRDVLRANGFRFSYSASLLAYRSEVLSDSARKNSPTVTTRYMVCVYVA